MEKYLFTNGTVVTMQDDEKTSPSCAVQGDKIIGVGKPEKMKKLLGPNYKEIDMGGGALFPGFIDCHLHFVLTAFFKMNTDLMPVKSISELLSVIKNKVGESPPGKWIMGLRFREDDYPEKRIPSLSEIDSVSPENPVILVRYDGHSALVNSKALDEAGITAETPDPDGGVIVREDGKLTGLVKELAVGSILSAFPTPDVEEFRKGHQLTTRMLLSYGITSINSILETTEDGPAGSLGPFEVPIFKLFEGDLPIRTYPMIAAPNVKEAIKVLTESFGAKKIDGRWHGGAIKLFSDGTFGSRTAYLSQDYADTPGERGFMVHQIEELKDIIFEAQGEGLQVCVHAIGDRAVSELAHAFLEAREKIGGKDLRHRIEHAGMIDPEDYGAMIEARLVASAQPSFIVSEGTWIESRVGDRLNRVYPLRDFIDKGIPVVGGSDSPVEDPNVLAGIQGAILREGFTKDQALTHFEAVSLYTSRAGYSSFEEDVKGTITPGKLSDLVLLSANPIDINPKYIQDIEVKMTMVGGEVLYEAFHTP